MTKKRGRVSRVTNTAARASRRALTSASPTMPTGEINVGQRLKQLRAEHNLTSRELSEKSGLAVNTLSLIENDKTSPSVSTLQQIATALDVPIVAFFESNLPPTSIGYTKSNQRPRAKFGLAVLEDLGAGVGASAIEPFVVTLEPYSSSGTQSIVHTGYEFVYCLSGRILYTIEDRPYLLEPGDSLLFESHLPHRWQNIHAEPTQMLLVLYPLDKLAPSRARHFERHFPSSA